MSITLNLSKLTSCFKIFFLIPDRRYAPERYWCQDQIASRNLLIQLAGLFSMPVGWLDRFVDMKRPRANGDGEIAFVLLLPSLLM